MPDRLLTTKEVGEIMEPPIHSNNVSRLCRAGKIPGAQFIGGIWLIPESSIPLIKKDETKTRKDYR